MSLRLRLFGAPTMEVDGVAHALPFERRHQLVAFLALRRDWAGRAELARLLWPGQAEKLAYANLRKTLFRLQPLPWASAVEARGQALRCAVPTDLLDFEAALAADRSADAVALGSGEFLAGFEDDGNEAWSSWLGFERDRLAQAWRGAALARLEEGDDVAAAIALSARLLERDPLDEAALAAHLRSLARDGQRGRARQAYRLYADRLRDELGLTPGADLKLLHDELGTTAGPAEGRAAGAGRGPDRAFVGRAVELRRVEELLTGDACRLLTLLGPGGVGKTRLARQALQRLAPRFADGAVFVPLEDVATPAELGGRLAREAGVRLAGSADAVDQAIESLRGRRLLLVLDNLEQVVAGTPLLDRLLAGCPHMRMLVTSRVRLGSAAEWTFVVDGLPCPEPEDRDEIEGFDAARLFIAAARRVEPGLVIAPEAAAIVDICRRVNGLPLALELAAAWTRVLSCEAIAAELAQGMDLLRTVEAGQPPRHGSIALVFEQSWRLLTPAEREALARLSVFRGGFTAEAARIVAGTSWPVLGALADKSMLHKHGDRGARQRLALHPLLHEFAAERLDHASREETERAHAHHFLRLLTQNRTSLQRGEREALRQLDADYDNSRAAWRWAAAHGAVELLAQCALALLAYFDDRGRFEEGLTLLGEAGAAESDPRHGPLLASVAAHFAYRLDRYAEAAQRAERAYGATRDRGTRLRCLKVLGGCALRLGRLDEAHAHFSRGLEQVSVETDARTVAALLDNLALVEKSMGRYEEAMRLSMESLAHYQRLGDMAGAALCLNNLGVAQMDRGELDAAGNHFAQGLALCEGQDLLSTRGMLLANMTELAMKRNDLATAAGYVARALDVVLATGNRSVECWLRLQQMQLAVKRDDLASARESLQAALVLAMDIGRPYLQLAGLSCFGELLAAQGEKASAARVMHFVAAQPAMARGRHELHTRIAEWGHAADAIAPWSGPDLSTLVHRVVLETPIAHRPLIAELRAAG